MEKSYTESFYYHIGLTARYLKILASQIFENVHANISFEDFIVLDLLKTEGKMCQRDLAKFLLKDRGNTGRILQNLEKKNYIDIKIETKGQRIIKMVYLAEQGREYLEFISKKLRDVINKLRLHLDEKFEEQMVNSLKHCQDKIKQLIELQI